MSKPMIAGVQTIGINQEEVKILAVGWSAKKNILGKAVYNDNNEKIGTIDDVIISPDHTVSFVRSSGLADFSVWASTTSRFL